MLRTDNGNVSAHSSNIIYKQGKKSCKSEKSRPRCRDGQTELDVMNDFHRKNACAVYSCAVTKKCAAKVGMHDSNGNFLTKDMIGMNVKADMNIGSNQIGYVYQEKDVLDTSALMQKVLLGGDRELHSVATLLALRNSEQYGSATTWDGNHSGYFCVSCPPRAKPCPVVKKCKKADPFNAPVGLGSDVIEARGNLRDNHTGQSFQKQATPPVQAGATTIGAIQRQIASESQTDQSFQESKGSGMGQKDEL